MNERQPPARPEPVNLRRLPEQPQCPEPSAPFQIWTLPDQSVWALFYRRPPGYLLRFPGMADFQISVDGLEVIALPTPGTPEASLQHLYLNQVMPLALTRQGRLVLHGSAIETHGQALAFLGPSGHGKSTLAAAFSTSGQRFLTDDGLHVDLSSGEPLVAPSHPSLRLWEDSSLALVGSSADAAPAVHYTRKTRFLAGDRLAFCAEPRPLRRAYLLGPGVVEKVTIRRCLPSDSFMGMVRNSFLLDIGEHGMLARHFDEIATLANLPIHYHLDYPRDYSRLPEVRAAVLRHLEHPEELQ